MQGVGPGTVLGGRYTVHRRLEQRDGAERWTGVDDTLRREVTLLVVPATHPQADALLDAARRAAGVDNAHLVRILDVGRADSSAYVVEEDLSSAQTLASLAARGGLPAEEVRRIVGVASRALEGARLRGLHHEALTPASVVRTADGQVKVFGLATAAALAGREGSDPETASRRDAVAIVALAYAGLTGRWPLASDSGGLSLAPRFVGGVAAPSEIAAGVPQDLDTICRQTLVDNQGPTTPGDLARQIAPWSHEPVGSFGTGDNTSEQDGGSAARTQVPPAGAAGRGPVRSAPAPAVTERLPLLDSPPPGDSAAPAAPVHPAGPADVVDPDGPSVSSTEPLPVLAGAAGPPGGDDPAYDESADATTEPDDGDATGGTDTGPPARRFPTHPEAKEAGAGAGASVAAALGSATSAAGQAVGAVSGRVGDLARTAVDRAQGRRAAKVAAAEWTEEHRVPLADTLEAGSDAPTRGSEPLVGGPLIDPDAVEPLTRNESKLALGIVAGLLILALVAGIYGVSRMGKGVSLGLGADSTETTLSAPRTTATTTTPGQTATSAPPATGSPIKIAGVKAFDPLGDRKENDAALGRIVDGDPSSIWISEGYSSANLGGIKKGVGVILDLGSAIHPSSVQVNQTTPSAYTVYLASSDSLDGATKVGSKDGGTGPVSLPVPADAKGRYVIVWFTRVASNSGRFRASLAEVKVTG